MALLFGMAGRPELSGTALRALLRDVGYSDDAARALLSRMRRRGQLAATRRGREAHYRLDGSTARGFEYIRRRSRGDVALSPWDGAFHTVLHSVPEADRPFRDALRRAAYLAGYGTLQPGVLVAPRDYGAQLDEVLADRPAGAQVVIGRLAVDRADVPRLVAVAWDLDRVASTYAEHADALRRLLAQPAPRSGAAALRAYAATVAPALSATLAEPDVPIDLLPVDWPGPDLRSLADRCGQGLGRRAVAHVAATVEEESGATRVG